MFASSDAIEVFLQPGEVYFGDRTTRIRTVLGSCVAITVWHPRHKIGGMCHYMLARRKLRHVGELDGRYADEALQLLLREIAAAGGNPREYIVKLFGGGNMFVHASPPTKHSINVADDNVVAGRALLARHSFSVSAEHLGGHGHRQVIFEIGTGDVWVRKHGIAGMNKILSAEAR